MVLLEMPVIDEKKCNGCGLCITVCSSFKVVNDVVVAIAREDCDWCLQCELVCPTEAIAFPFAIVIEED